MSLSTQWHRFGGGGGWAWLRTVERRNHIEHGEYRWTEYRGQTGGQSNG